MTIPGSGRQARSVGGGARGRSAGVRLARVALASLAGCASMLAAEALAAQDLVRLNTDPALNKQRDVIVSGVRFGASGAVEFTIGNRGGLAVDRPFVSDVFVAGRLAQTVKHEPLGPRSSLAVTSAARADGCAAVEIVVQADAQKVLTEADTENNRVVRTLTPPCPDLAVTSVKRVWHDMNTRYNAAVTVTNVGSIAAAVATPLEAAAWATGRIPQRSTRDLPPLAPGESYTFHIGPKVTPAEGLNVSIILDLRKRLPESNEDNNHVQRKI